MPRRWTADSVGKRYLLAIAAATLCVLVVCLFVVREKRARAACEDNLRRIGAALRNYVADDKPNRYPEISKAPGRLMFDWAPMCPRYLEDAACMISPCRRFAWALRQRARSDPQSALDDSDYWYLGWVFANERSALEWIGEYRQHAPLGEPIKPAESTWPEYGTRIEEQKEKARSEYEAAPGRFSKGNFRYEPWMTESMRFYFPMREGIERYLITDVGNPLAGVHVQATIPVVFEHPEIHGDGGHVLYLDGHVEFVPYPGKFPMTPRFIDGLRSLESLRPEAR